MADVLVVEFLGGPLDGRMIPVSKQASTIVVRTPAGEVTYYDDVVVEGGKARLVFRAGGVV